jgi:hypothetical protein
MVKGTFFHAKITVPPEGRMILVRTELIGFQVSGKQFIFNAN